ncbi:hypothetical protein [Aegicerativicinus sediminis]|uniref:hypothetical protein n=1 Tax=Aegicerativicinus sediminis TaxID=2893202 RepID=UPI001E602478|nr:hypothetical protein [Aegicerativicinus sediminis]
MSKDLFFDTRAAEVAALIDRVERGERRALTAYAEIKRHKELYTDAEKEVFDYALEEAGQYSDNTFSEDGFEFTKRSGATRYSFKHIPEWQEANAKVKEIEERYKQVYKTVSKGVLVASADGEEMVLPEVSHNKDSISVKEKY